MTPIAAERLQRAFLGALRLEPSVAGLAILGSWARREAHDGSDLDLLILTDDLDRWSGDPVWLIRVMAGCGHAAASIEAECWGLARTWRARSGVDVEVDATVVDLGWAATEPVDPGTRTVAAGGLKVLFDRGGRLRDLRAVLATSAAG